jgi:polyisoprenoid-binding protein YceI
MRSLGIVLCAALLLFVTGNLNSSEKLSETKRAEQAEKSSAVVRYRLDAAQSKFVVHAFRGGVAWFKGHDHYIAARDFTGEAQLTLDAVNPASLKLTVRADSLEETDAAFTPQQKQIIKKELEDLVLETKKYPEITFESTDVQGNLNGGQIDVKIGGNLTLHGVTKRIVIPARVTASGETLRAQGEFEINRKDFNVNATNAFHGTVRIKHELKFTFDIVGQRIS